MTSKKESPKSEPAEMAPLVEPLRYIGSNFSKYFQSVGKVRSMEEWIALNRELLDTPYAGIDQVRKKDCHFSAYGGNSSSGLQTL